MIRFVRFCSSILISAALLAACVSSDPRFEAGLAAFDRGDNAGALAAWRQAALDGDADAQNGVGWLYDNGLGVGRDETMASIWYEKAAGQGHGGAALNLGNLFDDGRGVPRDYGRAAELFRVAAEQGYAEAQNNLGRMLRDGDGIDRDLEMAVHWLRRAAKADFAPAQNSLGVMYVKGLGVRQDPREAYFWIKLAVMNGQPGAEQNLIFVKSFLDPDVIEAENRRARSWFDDRT